MRRIGRRINWLSRFLTAPSTGRHLNLAISTNVDNFERRTKSDGNSLWSLIWRPCQCIVWWRHLAQWTIGTVGWKNDVKKPIDGVNVRRWRPLLAVAVFWWDYVSCLQRTNSFRSNTRMKIRRCVTQTGQFVCEGELIELARVYCSRELASDKLWGVSTATNGGQFVDRRTSSGTRWRLVGWWSRNRTRDDEHFKSSRVRFDSFEPRTGYVEPASIRTAPVDSCECLCVAAAAAASSDSEGTFSTSLLD